MPFQVDQVLIMTSPFTGDAVEVVYRGPADADHSVVYNEKTGWQSTVDDTWLSRPLDADELSNLPRIWTCD